MPGKDFSSKIGKSSSPIANRVIQNNKDVQRVLPTKGATKQAYNKQPVKCK
jgi:hypothetical protein